MKREGRQHGMVRTFRVLPDPLNPRPYSRLVNKLDCPPTAGSFTKVRPKPTNHSKFTGKCGKPRCTECHLHPATKSKEKTKGTQKVKSSDVVSNYRLKSWRAVNGRPGFNISGSSATRILDHLDSSDHYMDDEGHEDGFMAEEEEIDESARIDYDDDLGFGDVGVVLEQVEGDDDGGWCVVGEM
ncbi:hypothetical protein HS088_TW06G01097 [Tripterygium wilfordii]|uniref:Uncharacterized protein n=1 Tax=Tripterygium wilfordii TaxID=458696 RepID=A0A7J7DKR1_TRIWF|nr:uncharacterized protein LOC119999361 [Tripterygium wilfordii]KAF5746921.1 hypothetical protein HS088_TW06G01097 [Tripterygium wilfordii]